jgi:hypothetical protein
MERIDMAAKKKTPAKKPVVKKAKVRKMGAAAPDKKVWDYIKKNGLQDKLKR